MRIWLIIELRNNRCVYNVVWNILLLRWSYMIRLEVENIWDYIDYISNDRILFNPIKYQDNNNYELELKYYYELINNKWDVKLYFYFY